MIDNLKAEIDKLPRIKVGNSNSPTVRYCIDEVLLYDLLDNLSSAEKTAKWKPLDKEKAQYYMFGYVCSKCGAPAKSPTKYCPNCGFRMKGV